MTTALRVVTYGGPARSRHRQLCKDLEILTVLICFFLSSTGYNASKPADRDEAIHMNEINCSRRARHFDFVSLLCCVTVLVLY
jgi:hypothetical protein